MLARLEQVEFGGNSAALNSISFLPRMGLTYLSTTKIIASIKLQSKIPIVMLNNTTE
ncbi:hypothetical protein VCRA217O17_160059 [Vibrio crassostreae]|nr:hypothetical protein VCRA217O17_160059 [Vibrio crassostreae]